MTLTNKQITKNNPVGEHTKTSVEKFLLLISTSACILLGTLQIFLSTKISTKGEEITTYEQNVRRLYQEIAEIEAKIEKTSSLSHIEKQARHQLKMVDVTNQILYLGPDSFASAQN